MPLILGTNSIKDTGFNVANSLRFNDDDSPMLQITPSSSATNSKKMTISFWCKRSNLGINGRIFSADTSDSNSNRDSLFFDSNDKLYLFLDNGSPGNLRTNRLFRDVSAWYHIVIAIDTTQSTNTNRVKFYINGVQETSFDSSGDGIVYPSQNYDIVGFGQNGREATIGADTDNGGNDNEFDGYLAELVFIDGQQLDPTSFGEFDSDSPNIWKPIDVSGLTFGTNGFYLDFENASSLGADVSGNSNNFTVNNLTSVDQSTDTCTNNFATLNPLDFTGSITASEGNTVFQGGRYKATFGVSSGKWYWEAKRLNAPDNAYIGIKADDGDWNNSYNNSYTYYTSNGNYYLNGSSQGSYGSSSTTNDILIFALDMDNGKFYVGENGTFYNSGNPASGTNPMASSISGTYLPVVINNSASGTDQYSFNFGNPSFSISSGNADANGFGNFEYAVPSGYFALCTKNLAEHG